MNVAQQGALIYFGVGMPLGWLALHLFFYWLEG